MRPHPAIRCIPFALALVLTTTGCSRPAEFESNPRKTAVDLGHEATEEDEERLRAMMIEFDDIGYELESAVKRLLRECMEDKGFTVHDETELYVWPAPEPDELLEFDSPLDHLPTAREAAENGFMAWAVAYEGSEFAPEEDTSDMEDYWALLDGPWFELDREQRLAWERAYWGVESIRYRENSDDAARLDRPAPGGCQAQVKQPIFGKARKVVDEEREYAYWDWGTPNPLWEDWDPAQDVVLFRDLTAEKEAEFLTCLDDGGNTGWDFNDEGYIDTYWWLHDLYPPDPANAGIEFDPLPDWQLALMPEVPADAPYDYDTAFGMEIELAVEFAACADDTGYREHAEETWHAVQIGSLLEKETEAFAWQEEFEGYLEAAQALLDA